MPSCSMFLILVDFLTIFATNQGRIPIICTLWAPFTSVTAKGVGPSTTLAWPGWKHPDIAVEVDTSRLERSRFKKCNVYWHGEGAAGLSCTELSIWEFRFLRGVCWQGGNSIWYCLNGMPRRKPWKMCVHLYASVSYRRLSPQFKFSLSGVTLYMYIYICGFSSPPL